MRIVYVILSVVVVVIVCIVTVVFVGMYSIVSGQQKHYDAIQGIVIVLQNNRKCNKNGRRE